MSQVCVLERCFSALTGVQAHLSCLDTPSGRGEDPSCPTACCGRTGATGEGLRALRQVAHLYCRVLTPGEKPGGPGVQSWERSPNEGLGDLGKWEEARTQLLWGGFLGWGDGRP